MPKGYYLPLIGVILYVSMGILVSFYGPLKYLGYNRLPVFIYISTFLVLFSIGFCVGARSPLTKRAHPLSDAQKNRIIRKILVFCVFTSALFMTYEFVTSFLAKGLSLNLANSGAAYAATYDGYVRNSGSYSLNFLLGSIGAFPLFVTQIWGLYYYKSLNPRLKALVIFVFVMTVIVYTVGGGKQKQFGDIMVYVAVILILRQVALNRFKTSTLVKIVTLLLMGVYFLLTILAYRYQNIGIDLNVLNKNLHHLIYYEKSDFLEGYLGPAGTFPLVIFSGYLGQGYYGLSLSMEQDFTWTAFAGSSYSLSVVLNQFLGLPFMVEHNYPYMVGDQTGWAATKWHTAFSWLASDFTFPGTLILFLFIAFWYGRAWKEAVFRQNPFSVLLVLLLSVGLMYLPANNQLMHSPGGLWTLGWVVGLYAVYRKRFN